MLSLKPTYFLAPPRSYPQDSPIRLGSVIASPSQPDEPIYLPPLPSSSDISTFTEKNWSTSHIQNQASQFGVWTSFLEMVLNVGADGNARLDEQVRKWRDVESLKTMNFQPSDAFIEDTVAAKEVRRFVVGNQFREKIYLVTGVMIAKTTSAFREMLEERDVYIHADVDATAWAGVPISVGPEGRWRRNEMVRGTREIRGRIEREEEFVFAFRVREIRVRRSGGAPRGHKFSSKGALFELEGKKKTEAVEEEEEGIEIEGLADEPGGDDFGLETKVVKQKEVGEGDEECICVIPEEQ